MKALNFNKCHIKQKIYYIHIKTCTLAFCILKKSVNRNIQNDFNKCHIKQKYTTYI